MLLLMFNVHLTSILRFLSKFSPEKNPALWEINLAVGTSVLPS